MGVRIYEVPIVYHGRTYAEGKKISWTDGVKAFYDLVKYRFKGLGSVGRSARMYAGLAVDGRSGASRRCDHRDIRRSHQHGLYHASANLSVPAHE